MSNVYINEPTTTGKVVIKTSVGDIDVELWCKETPKACRNFIQLAMEGYYNNTIFHRVVKDFIVQGGDATGTGLGGESIYGEPFKDEFHSRLKFGRRGLVALANAGKDDNSSQFFFTMGAAPELQNKHTIFGKVTGTTIFNMLKLQEGIVDQNERPEFPQRIISIEILKNPFDDIVPREIKQDKKVEKKKVESKSKATKDFKLLSFGDEAEEEEENLDLVLKSDFKIKKSYVPDLVEDAESTDDKNKEKSQENKEEKNTKKIIESFDKENSSSEDEYEKEKKKMEQVKSEIEKLKKEVIIMKKKDKIDDQKKKKSDSLVELEKNNEKFKRNFSSGSKREQQSLMMLEKFKQKLKDKSLGKSSWLKHKLQTESEEEKLVLAKDANLKNEADWYDIYDPRNPINKQRREAQSDFVNKKKKN